MKKDTNQSDEILGAVKGLGIVFAAVIAGPPALLALYYWRSPNKIAWMKLTTRIWIAGLVLTASFCSWYLWLDPSPLYSPDFLQAALVGNLRMGQLVFIPWFWVTALAGVFLGAPLILIFKKPDSTLRTSCFNRKIRDFTQIKKAFSDSLNLPLGVNVQTGQVETIDQVRRYSHVLVIGATGTGKSTLMFNSVLHAVKHGQPVIVIDPKGDTGSLQRFRTIASQLDPNFETRFKLFSMGSPDKSECYNPLKNGTSLEKKDRLLEALNWSEQYYQSIAGSYLSVILSAIELTNIDLTLDYLERVSLHKPVQRELVDTLTELARAGNPIADKLYVSLDAVFSKRGDDLAGLNAQISILNSATLGPLLSPNDPTSGIDFREALKKNQVVYFQMDVLGCGDTARRLGRMIVEDIKALGHFVYSTVPNEDDRKFLPVFIDEFGSFATREFVELLKQVRGAKFGVHLFCQGLEDLDAVSPEFRRQSVSNPMTTLAFRVVDNETVNEVAAIAGTSDALEQSHQVEGQIVRLKTGMGNLRETKQMRLEHDVLRNLNNLQATLIEKSPSRLTGIQVYFPDILRSTR